jgi:hypothetical protein
VFIVLKRILIAGITLLLCTLVACGGSSGTTGNTSASTPTPTQQPQALSTTTPAKGTPGTGPIVITTPTPAPGGNSHSQLVILADRTLTINDVTKQAGSDSSLTAVTLMLMIKNTGSKSIKNQETFFQLVSSEGDSFGAASGTPAGFFGTIAPHDSRTGSLVFQIPLGAMNGLRLLYRSEFAEETVFVTLNIQ